MDEEEYTGQLRILFLFCSLPISTIHPPNVLCGIIDVVSISYNPITFTLLRLRRSSRLLYVFLHNSGFARIV